MSSPELQSLDLFSDSPLLLPAMGLIRSEVLSGGLTAQEYLSYYQKTGADFYTLTDDAELAAVGSLLFVHANTATIGVLAVRSRFQWRPGGVRYGYGSLLLGHLEQQAMAKGPEINQIKATAHVDTVEFYLGRDYNRDSPQSRRVHKNLRQSAV